MLLTRQLGRESSTEQKSTEIQKIEPETLKHSSNGEFKQLRVFAHMCGWVGGCVGRRGGWVGRGRRFAWVGASASDGQRTYPRIWKHLYNMTMKMMMVKMMMRRT